MYTFAQNPGKKSSSFKENSIKNKKWKIFSKNQKLDLNMIWDHDKYWKASPRSTLKDFNNDLTIFYDLDEILNKIWAPCKISLKMKIWSFFEKYRKSTSRLIKSFWYVRRWKKHAQMMFPRCCHDWKNFEMNIFFKIFYAIFYWGFLCIIPLGLSLCLYFPWLFKKKMSFKKFSIGRVKNLTAVPYSDLGSKNSFSLSF